MIASYRSPWLDDELESFRGTVRRFARDVLAPREPAWQAAHRVDTGSWREMGAMGLLLCGTSEAYGGSGGTFAHDCIVFEELGYAGVASFGKSVHNICAHYVERLRDRGAEAELAAAARDRRARRRDRDVRAWRRVRPARDPHAGGPEGRCLRPGWLEDLHHQWPGRQLPDGRREDRCGGRVEGHLARDGRDRRARRLPPGPHARQDRNAGSGHLRALLRRLRGARGRAARAVPKGRASRR